MNDNDHGVPHDRPKHWPLNDILPLIREIPTNARQSRVQVLAILPDKIIYFSRKSSPVIPDECFEPEQCQKLAVFAKRYKPTVLTMQEIQVVRISAARLTLNWRNRGKVTKSRISENTNKLWFQGDGYQLEFIVEGKTKVDCWLPAAETSLVAAGLHQLGRAHGWTVEQDPTLESNSPLLFKSARKPAHRKNTLLWIILGGFFAMTALLGGFAVPSGSPPLLGIFASSVALSIILLFALRKFEDARRKRQTGNSAGREPFRSIWLHWLLKLLAATLLWLYFQIDLPEEITRNNSFATTALTGWVFTLAATILHAAHRMARRPLPKGSITNTANHCLYLRSFNRDLSGSFNTLGATSAFFGLNPNISSNDARAATGWGLWYRANPLTCFRLLLLKARETAEEQLIGTLAKIIPVVAIGKPGDSLSVLGAHRAYVTDDEWKQAVTRSLDSASMVLIQPGASTHIFWEIDQSLRRLKTWRILFWLTGMERRQALYDHVRLHLQRRTNLRLPRALGLHDFLMLDPENPRMLERVEKSPFLWPLVGCSVDFRRTLAPFLAPLTWARSERRTKNSFLRRFRRRLVVISAALTWQIVSAILILVALGLIGLANEQWQAWNLRSSLANIKAAPTGATDSRLSFLQWSAPEGWRYSTVYGQTGKSESSGAIHNYNGWAYDETAFIFFREKPMDVDLAQAYETSPEAFLIEALQNRGDVDAFKLGPARLLKDGDRCWAEATLTTNRFSETWREDTTWFRLFAPATKGIVRTTIGPERMATVFALAPSTAFPMIRHSLGRTLDRLKVAELQSEPTLPRVDGKFLSRLVKASIEAPPTRHPVSALRELEVALPPGWASDDGRRFNYNNVAMLSVSLRPRELGDDTLKSAAERDIRHAEVVDKVVYKNRQYSTTAEGILVSCETDKQWMIQHTRCEPSGVITLRSWCRKALYYDLAPLLTLSVQGTRPDRAMIAKEQNIAAGAAKSRKRSARGNKFEYRIDVPSSWEAGEANPPIDLLLLGTDPVVCAMSVVYENKDAIGLFPEKSWQKLAHGSFSILEKAEEIQTVEREEAVCLAKLPDSSFLRFRCLYRTRAGETFQRTIYVRDEPSRCFTITCTSAFKTPAAHDAIFDPLLRNADWGKP